MDAKGRLVNVYRDWKTGKITIVFETDWVDENAVNEIANIDELDITIKKHTKKRSLNANAYFHVLCGKIAAAITADNISVKNRLIREYGQYEYIDGFIPTYLVKAEYEDMLLAKEGVHFSVIGYEHIEGNDYIKVAAMRGSHTYNSREMARLIDGTIEEAKALGIETLPPDELERMLKKWNGITGKNA